MLTITPTTVPSSKRKFRMNDKVKQKIKELREAVAEDIGADSAEDIDIVAATLTRVEDADPIFVVTVGEKIEISDRAEGDDDAWVEIQPGYRVNAGPTKLSGLAVVVDRDNRFGWWMDVGSALDSGTKAPEPEGEPA